MEADRETKRGEAVFREIDMATLINPPNPEDYVESAPLGVGGVVSSAHRLALGRISNLKAWLKNNPSASKENIDAARRMLSEAESERSQAVEAYNAYRGKQFSGR